MTEQPVRFFYKDFETGKRHWTRGRFIGWTPLTGPLTVCRMPNFSARLMSCLSRVPCWRKRRGPPCPHPNRRHTTFHTKVHHQKRRSNPC